MATLAAPRPHRDPYPPPIMPMVVISLNCPWADVDLEGRDLTHMPMVMTSRSSCLMSVYSSLANGQGDASQMIDAQFPYEAEQIAPIDPLPGLVGYPIGSSVLSASRASSA